MRHLFSLFTTVCFFVWLLPLGAFIKPSQEKTACDGQRPFHMCSMMSKVKTGTDANSKIHITNASGTNAAAKSTTSGGDDFLMSGSTADILNSHSFFYGLVKSFSYQLFLRTLEHIPIV